jgi:hypothetical protein
VKWPQPGVQIHLNDLDRFGDQRACKLFSNPLTKGQAAIANSRLGERVVFSWNVEENPTLGIWICTGAWDHHYQMAIEPTNVPAEFLSEAALRRDEFPLLQPGEKKRWQLRIRLERF